MLSASKILQDNITRILKHKGWTIQDLERKAGTNRSIYNIFRNRNPSVDLVHKITKALGVSYSELLDEYNEKTYIKNLQLFSDVSNVVIHELQKLPKEINITFESVFIIMHEVYQYAAMQRLAKIDVQFVKWTLIKHFDHESLKP